MNQQILSQDEVDALLQGITGESQKLDAEEANGSTGGVRNYDLASQERIVRGRMPTMEVINERFARNIRVGLFNLIRKSPEVSIGGIKVQKFSAFLREIVVPTNFNIMSVRPLRGAGLIVCDPNLVFAVIDALFGGAGKFHTRIEGRDFSPTEQRVIHRLVETITTEYGKAWQGIYPLVLDYQRSEMQPQFANIATPGEIVVTTSFTLEIGETTGTMHFCIPYSTLEPIRDVLYSTVQGDAAGTDRRWVTLLQSQIQAAEVDLVVELGHAPATVEQLLSFKAGDFVELDLEPVIQAKVDGVPLFDCNYGTSNGHYSIKVQQLLTTGSSVGWLGDERHGR
jgi:flagellar motor switch protein FliM